MGDAAEGHAGTGRGPLPAGREVRHGPYARTTSRHQNRGACGSKGKEGSHVAGREGSGWRQVRPKPKGTGREATVVSTTYRTYKCCTLKGRSRKYAPCVKVTMYCQTCHEYSANYQNVNAASNARQQSHVSSTVPNSHRIRGTKHSSSVQMRNSVRVKGENTLVRRKRAI